MREIDLATGWQVLQDVHHSGEYFKIYQPDFVASMPNAISPWMPLPRLAHLQVLLAKQPYFGRELRGFNQYPWWYRLDFQCPNDGAAVVRLRFEGVDYFANVWLNGQALGAHEGYNVPFEFDVSAIARRGQANVLVVKVSAPWDEKYLEGGEDNRVGHVLRNQIKGTYEHADTFVQRDVNPIGIWAPVKLITSECCCPAGRPCVTSAIAADRSSAELDVSWPVASAEGINNAELVVRIEDESTGLTVAELIQATSLKAGANALQARLPLKAPKLWSTWDRGGAQLYRAQLLLRRKDSSLLSAQTVFGVRSVALRRSDSETSFVLNGQKLFVRGTTYFPDVYVSQMSNARYERDVRAMIAAGCNAVRVHVHVEKQAFYDVCDRLGILVLQDNELNWHFPHTDEFFGRADKIFAAMIQDLKSHPSIAAWVCLNEAPVKSEAVQHLGRLLEQTARRIDPTRATLRNTWDAQDLASGDSHVYDGSLNGGSYKDIYGKKHKLLSEFGGDAPACAETLRSIPELSRGADKLMGQLAGLHDYQYKLLKYQIEYLRLRKYEPCSGYFQFMWIDLCPQSFYGVYDYLGLPKVEGLGGGLRAFMEANLPLGIFMEHTDKPLALWAVNDLHQDYRGCLAEWGVTTASGEPVARGSKRLDLCADTRQRITELTFGVQPEETYRVALVLSAASGEVLARNSYCDPFHVQSRLQGYPGRIDHELGMRLWNS